MPDVAIRPNTTNFDDIVRMAEAGIRAAVTAPPARLEAVKRPHGGYEMQVRPIGFFQRHFARP
jgi:hypothetical protein